MTPEQKEKVEAEIKTLWCNISMLLTEISELEKRRVHLINLLKQAETGISSAVAIGTPGIKHNDSSNT